jgi:asparagine synthase (glutamine-hydrolysing)
MQGSDSYRFVADRFRESNTQNRTEQAVYADFTTYLPDDLLAKVDIATMAVSLEGRSPFLDHELLELTAQIPFSLKLRGWNDKKYILKEALRGILPDEVMFREKMGFSIPLHAWFRGELREYAYETLLSERALSRGIFKSAAIKAFLDTHMDTRLQFGYHIWALVTLELWFREYFD